MTGASFSWSVGTVSSKEFSFPGVGDGVHSQALFSFDKEKPSVELVYSIPSRDAPEASLSVMASPSLFNEMWVCVAKKARYSPGPRTVFEGTVNVDVPSESDHPEISNEALSELISSTNSN